MAVEMSEVTKLMRMSLSGQAKDGESPNFVKLCNVTCAALQVTVQPIRQATQYKGLVKLWRADTLTDLVT